MNKTIKKLIVAVVALSLVLVGVVGGVIAWLVAESGTVTNTFTVGTIAITLDEAKVTEYGVEVADGGRVTANEYKLLPGHTYKKDPTVHIKGGSEECYVVMEVVIENFQTLLNAAGAGYTLPQQFIQDWDSSVWECKSYELDEKGTATMYFMYNGTVDAREVAVDKYYDMPALFEKICLPESITDVSALNTVKVVVQACAVQADSNTADVAYDTAVGTLKAN